MRIFYTEHARLRLRERSIARTEVEAVVASPDLLRLSFNGKLVASKQFGSRTLEVVFVKGKDKIIVVTIYPK